ncbi:MAG: thiosulfate oxidation carrier protein SoxY [Pseudolabrys sp.]|nr:thiosulfate oxidation carrier protein SoxY [Pseudolabrys sp.]
MRPLSRRHALAALGATGAALALTGWSDGALATVQEAADEIAKFTGGKAPVKAKITIELPEIAENGNTVPLRISVDSPMTADDYISDVLVVADGNPRPGVATFRFTPMSGKADISTRMRLAATQNIVVVAKTNTGALFTGQQQVTVTVGGCVG